MVRVSYQIVGTGKLVDLYVSRVPVAGDVILTPDMQTLMVIGVMHIARNSVEVQSDQHYPLVASVSVELR